MATRQRPPGTHAALRTATLLIFPFISSLISTPAYAQGIPPTISVSGTSLRPVSAAEAAHHVAIKSAQLDAAISFRDAHYPKDSMLQVVAQTGKEWVARLQTESVNGIQLDPAGDVGVRAGNEAYAKARIAERLANRTLSINDRAYTYLAAIRAFADWHYPERLLTAEAYLEDLDALGERVIPWRFEARFALQSAYHHLGNGAAIVRLGVEALELLPRMSYVDQKVDLFFVVGLYMNAVDVLTGLPNGRSQIDTLNAILRAITIAPARLVASDSAYAMDATFRKWQIEQLIATTAMLGTVGAPWVANYWVNRPAHDSATVALNDGKIRIVEAFSYGCEPCVEMLPGLQRLQTQFPNIEVLAVTRTFGAWGNRLVEPFEEAQKLEDFFVHQIKATIPIGIWAGQKVLGDDGGRAPGALDDPNETHYPTLAKPMLWVFDGRGRIRHVYLGGGRAMEGELARAVEFLERETRARAENH